jgi:hypothetical protein
MVLMSQKLESEDYDSDSEDLLTTGRHARRTHYSFVKNVEAYRSYFEQFLCCCFVWGDGSETLQDFPEPVRDVLVSFSIQVRHCTQAGDDDAMDEMCLHIQTLLLGLSNRRAETREGYPNDPMQRCVIGLLLDEKTGFAEHEARANKLANSLKYFIRGVWLIEIVDNEDKVLVARKCLDLNGFSPFAGLHRVQNGLVAFKKVQQERVNFLNDQRMVVDNVELGPNVFQKTIQVCEFQCNKLLERVLLRDFDQSSMEENFPILSKETLSYEHFAELTQSVDDPGAAFGVQKHDTRWGLLLHHFFDSGNGPVRFRIKGEDLRVKNIADAHKYLRDCLKFERLAMAMMHFLTGCSNRATTEFAGMNFRNGGRINIRKKVSSRSSFSVVQDSEGNCEWIHIEGTSAKTSLLKGIPVDKSQLVPRKKIRSLLAYFLVVRPFAITLGKMLKKVDERKRLLARYRVALELFTEETLETIVGFLQGKSSQVTLNVTQALQYTGTETTFNSCRHAGQAIFARWVVPKEHALQREYDINSSFGHSALVGVDYGAGVARGNARLSSKSKSIDLCAILRIFSSYHRLLESKAITEEELHQIVDKYGLNEGDDVDVENEGDDVSNAAAIAGTSPPAQAPAPGRDAFAPPTAEQAAAQAAVAAAAPGAVPNPVDMQTLYSRMIAEMIAQQHLQALHQANLSTFPFAAGPAANPEAPVGASKSDDKVAEGSAKRRNANASPPAEEDVRDDVGRGKRVAAFGLDSQEPPFKQRKHVFDLTSSSYDEDSDDEDDEEIPLSSLLTRDDSDDDEIPLSSLLTRESPVHTISS